MYMKLYLDIFWVSSMSSRSKKWPAFIAVSPRLQSTANISILVRLNPRLSRNLFIIRRNGDSSTSYSSMSRVNFLAAFKNYFSSRNGGVARPRIVRKDFSHVFLPKPSLFSCIMRDCSSSISFLSLVPRGAWFTSSLVFVQFPIYLLQYF